jgi:hypothetical protein
VLTPLQERVARIVGGLEEAEDFALAGGAALIVRGDVDRKTRDPDYFGPSADEVDELLPAVRRALEADGLTVRDVQVAAGFARLEVTLGAEHLEVDLGTDARLYPPEGGALGPMLTGEELAVDKVLAIFGRAEARDFYHLSALEPRYGLDRLCRLAADKDAGFSVEVFADMLLRFDRLGRQEFEIGDDKLASLKDQVASWRGRALKMARPRGLDRSDDEIGLER